MPTWKWKLNEIRRNDPTVKRSNLSSRDLFDGQMHELVFALLQNQYLETLNLYSNYISQQSSKALADTRTLGQVTHAFYVQSVSNPV